MENVQSEEIPRSRTITLAERLRSLEDETKLLRQAKQSKEQTKQFKWPLKWRFKFNKSKKKSMVEMMLVIFLNKKNQIEIPRFMPIFDGNMIVWKNKPYEFDPVSYTHLTLPTILLV